MSIMRRIGALCTIALLVLSMPACAAQATVEAGQQPHRQDFRDAPGVSQEEIEAIERLSRKYTSFTYGMLESAETFIRSDGQYGGYSTLFCAWLSELFGIRFAPKIYTWAELATLFDAGEIDFTGELTATDELRGKYFMTNAFTESVVKAFRLEGSEPLMDIARSRTLRFVFLDGSPVEGLVVSASPYPLETVLTDSVSAAIHMVQTGQVDAYCADEHNIMMPPAGIVSEDLLPAVYLPISFSASREELAPIVSVLDKCLQSGSFSQLAALHVQGDQEYLRHRFFPSLTPAERSYLSLHGANGAPISVIASPDAYPASFFNRAENEWQGIAFDLLKEISLLSDLEFSVINDPDEDWQSYLVAIDLSDAAMLSELVHTDERKDHYLWTDEPYARDHFALLSLSRHEDVTLNQLLYSRVGLIENTVYAEMFRKWFPDHMNTAQYQTSDDGFAALEKGEIDLLMGSSNMLLAATNYHEMVGYKANMVFDRTCESSFAFFRNQNELSSIMSKAQKLIDTGAIADRWTRRVFDYRGKLARGQVPYLFGLTALLFTIMGLLIVLAQRNQAMKRKLEVTVQERTAELVVASEAKSSFLSRMSHEIRTPLNAITGMAQIAKEIVQEDCPPALKPINELLTASSHLLGILNDVLDMSKIESGKFELASEDFPLSGAINDAISIIRPRCLEKGLRLTVDIDPRADTVTVGDRLRLKQVLINLLGNAVKFTHSGGRVGIVVKAIEDNIRSIMLTFEVIDTGIGMSKEQTDRLFLAFEQADSSISARYGGTGLGLAISQNLVHLMGGEITVSSEKDMGSTFRFTVRFEKGSGNLHLPAKEDEEAPDLSGKRIMVVEDIEVNRVVLAELLRKTHVDIEEASDGAQAVELFGQSPVKHFDLIFMDIMMPEMDGYEATRAIRALNRADAKTVPIIAMTANAYREDVGRALNAGMNGHLAKPIDIDEVMRALRQQLKDN